jgi:predicted dehydrogenase
MTFNEPITVAVAGCGQWGVNVVSAFARMKLLVAVTDSDIDQADKIARDHGVPALNWQSVLDDPSITAVALVTPAKDHARMIEEALLAGKHVYVEKPLALSASDAQAVTDLVARTGKTLLVGHILQYHPAFLALKSLVQQGKLGRLRFIQSTRFGPGRIRQDEDALWCLAPHDISMILGLTGQQPKSVRAHGSYFLRAGIADTVNTRLTFADNLEAEVAVSWAHPYKHRNLVVTGDEGTLVFDDDQPWDSKLRYFKNTLTWEKGSPNLKEGCSEAVPVEEKEPLMEQTKHFVECIRTARRPITDVSEGLSVVNVLEAATQAMCGQKEAPTKPPAITIPMVDLKAQQKQIKAKLDKRITDILVGSLLM